MIRRIQSVLNVAKNSFTTKPTPQVKSTKTNTCFFPFPLSLVTKRKARFPFDGSRSDVKDRL